MLKIHLLDVQVMHGNAIPTHMRWKLQMSMQKAATIEPLSIIFPSLAQNRNHSLLDL